MLKHIKRFPTLLQNDIPAKFLFSNNFTYFIDFDFEENQIVIMETKSEQPYCRIPTDMLNFNIQLGIKDMDMIPVVAKNICFGKHLTENLLIIKNRDNVECIFEFNKNELKMKSYSKINNEFGVDNPHNICLKSDMKPGEIFQRYIRKI